MSRVQESLEINAPVSTCYQYWSRFEEFPRFMKNVDSVTQKGAPGVWHWKVQGPVGQLVEWDAEVDRMEPNKVISWHSVRDADVDVAGAVTFDEISASNTRVNVRMEYNPPAGALGDLVATVFKNPQTMVREDLRNFKSLVEQQGYAGVSSQIRTGGIDDRSGGI